MMFINANPPVVSNGFGSFVPVQRTESLNQRLVEMTNNDVNAWSVFRPVASTNDNWDQHIGEFNNENLPEHSVYGGYFQEASPLAVTQPAHLPKTTPCSNSRQGHSQPRKASASLQAYHEPVLDMNYVQRPNPMLGAPYLQWGTDHGRGSFAEFSSSRCGLKDFSYQVSSQPDIAAFSPASPIAQAQCSYMETNSTMNELMDTKTCDTIAYNNLTSHGAGINQQSMIPQVEPSAVDNTVKTTWWPENARSADNQYHNTYGLFPSNDGLPRLQDTQQNQELGDLWNNGPISGNSWASRAAGAQSTISPKLLTLDAPSAPMSSSGSSQGSAISRSDCSSAPSIEEDASDFSGPETLVAVKQSVPIRPPRQILPDSLPSPRRALSIPPSDNFDPAQAAKRRSSRRTSASLSRKRDHSHGNVNAKFQRESRRSELASPKFNTPKKIEPKPLLEETFWAASNQSSATAQAMHHRDAKDDYLVRSKLAGMSYKDIRRQGKFTEAESTLRGRFRTLTKHKAARVRKPEWNDNDVRLLNRAVHKLTSSSDLSRNKVPWKSVAEYIANNGGSYHFGNATCRKRWDDLHGRSE